MVWYKSWLDTRWRFVFGLAVMGLMAFGILFNYSFSAQAISTLGANPDAFTSNATIKEAIRIEQTYRGFVWYQWFRQNLAQSGTVLGVILGVSHIFASSRGGLFALSLPASRTQWVAARTATGLAEFFALAAIPSVAISVLSPFINQHYSIVDTLAHATCFFVAAAVFYSLAFLLSTMFDDIYRPLLLAIAVACAMGLAEAHFDFNGLFHVMSGHRYFESGSLPWLGLFSSAAASAGMLYGATVNIVHKDF